MRIPDNKKLKILTSNEIASTIPLDKTYGPRMQVSIPNDNGEFTTKTVLFVNSNEFKLTDEMLIIESQDELEIILSDIQDKGLLNLLDVADSLMISIESCDEGDIKDYMKNSEYLIPLRIPEGIQLIYFNKEDITDVTCGVCPCEFAITEKNVDLIYTDLITIKEKSDKAEKIILTVTI